MEKMLKVGKIVGTHGIKGDLKVFPLTDYMERFEELNWVYMDGGSKKFYIKGVKYMPTVVLLSFEGYEDIDSVKKFKDRYLLIDGTQRRNLPEDTYYMADIIGMDIYTVENKYIGKVKDVVQTGSGEVYVIEDENDKEIMIPAVKEFIPEICLEEGKIIIDPIEGMM
ncbi:MAG TPA: ribosome maturation factor RimM [Clostridia bacterium]|nr:ribosome maturation factor RimM [Clostridia bacterium]